MVKYYITRCMSGHVWGQGYTKAESRKSAELCKKDQDESGVKLLPSEQVSMKLYESVEKTGGNVEDLQKFINTGKVLRLESESLEDVEIESKSFEYLDVSKKLDEIYKLLSSSK